MKTINYYLFLCVIILSITSCTDKESFPTLEEEFEGFLYTSTNSSTGNEVLAMGRNKHGKLTELIHSPFSTGDNGDAIKGNFDSQQGMMMVGHYLIVVNAGENPLNGSLSVFKADKNKGHLERIDQDPTTSTVDNCDSKGVRPVSMTHTFAGGKEWIIVANQYSNPYYEGSPASLNGSIQNTNLRNLTVFEFDQKTGILKFNNTDIVYNDGNYGGPVSIGFNSNGDKLAVTTWGVPHLNVSDPDPNVQQPSRVYVYDFNAGMLTESSVFEEEGISGTIGCSWSNNNNYLYVANSNVSADKNNNSITVLQSSDLSKVQNFATGNNNGHASWTCVSSNNLDFFTSSFTDNFVSSFKIDQTTNLLEKTLTPNYFRRNGNIPAGDTKDMFQFYDNKLYVSGAVNTHEISYFQIKGDGNLEEHRHSPFVIPSTANTMSYDNAFLGLTGFEREK
ncbi:hypothetical protein [Aureivirga sp. CE67]|uniref:hypothetical protein n=1 Tax=Aureivirga sp. CE67 TaxID=1788983 RepID=UPI0018C95B18|nr:hypothetical protein [Aureivirga sp. CE67]